MYFLGVDIGGTKIAAGVVDEHGTVIGKNTVATPAAEGGAAVLSAALQAAHNVFATFDRTVAAIGIGTGGQVDSESGTIVSATDVLPGWAGQPLARRFQEAFNLPVFIDNDVNALAFGESIFGAAKNFSSAAFIALGTGVGGAAFIDRKILRGAHFSGAEFGQIVIDLSNDARIDNGGRRGTLEAYVSGSGLIATWRKITGERIEMTAEQIAEEAISDSGGPATLAITQTGRYLGLGLVSIVSILDPAIIVLGGGLSALGDRLIGPAQQVLRERALPGAANCPIVPAALGPDSAIVGAACLAMELDKRT